MRKVKNQAITNKRKGHDFEREIVKIFKDLSEEYKFCKTARLASRLYDNCGFDIHGIPFLIQAKNVKAALNYGDIFDEMQKQLVENFHPSAPEHNYPKLIFHKRNKKRLVIMEESDFLAFLKTLHDRGSTK